jgi:hypothetical protein
MSSIDGKKAIFRGKIWKARKTYIKLSGYSEVSGQVGTISDQKY